MLKRISLPGWPGNLIALIAGVLMTLALAPFDFWPLALLSIALYYLGMRQLNPRQAFARGWFYGFGSFASGTSWVYVSIHQFGAASAPLAALLTLAFVAGLGLLFAFSSWVWVRWLRNNHTPVVDALGFAALWLAQEAFRSWFLTGFPWLYAGYSQLNGPLAALAPIAGVWLISFSLALTAALLSNLPQLRRPYPWAIALILLAAPWLSALPLKNQQWTEPTQSPIRVAAVQGNVEQNLKWDPDQLRAQLLLYRQLTLNTPAVDLVVWPETAVPVLRSYAQDYLEDMNQLLTARNSALITGIPVRQANAQGELRYYNGIMATGQGDGLYLKQKLVPFGEYVPLQDMLRGLIAFFDLPMSDFARGPSEQAPLQVQGFSIAPFICYEVVYPDFAAELAAQSQLLLTISNDAWFGDSLGPQQHLQMAQMRALEAGRWMIRATNNGITALITPSGQISQQLPQFEQAVLIGEVQPMQGLTPFLRWGSWPLTLLCTLLLIWAGILHYRQR